MGKVKILNYGFCYVDEIDVDWTSYLTWTLFETKGLLYVQAFIYQRSVLMHRMIMGAKQNEIIDHVDCDGLNNVRSNLRFATSSQNAHHFNHSNTTSGYRGVYKGVNKWRSTIMKDGIKYELGYFNTKEEAALAYDKKARELYGEFAAVNFEVNP